MCTPQAGRIAADVGTLGLYEAVRPSLGHGTAASFDNWASLGLGPSLSHTNWDGGHTPTSNPMAAQAANPYFQQILQQQIPGSPQSPQSPQNQIIR